MGYATPIKKTTIHGGAITTGQGVRASLTTALTGTNNDLVITARDRLASGNNTTFRIVVAGASTALSVSVTGTAITVNSATDGASAATSTAAQVSAAILANLAAAALVTTANAASNDGTGVVTALSVTSLAGGVDYGIGSRNSGLGISTNRALTAVRSV